MNYSTKALLMDPVLASRVLGTNPNREEVEPFEESDERVGGCHGR